MDWMDGICACGGRGLEMHSFLFSPPMAAHTHHLSIYLSVFFDGGMFFL